MRIINLRLDTKNIERQKQFYSRVLELPIHSDSPDSFVVHLAHTKIYFKENLNATPYHFAINIPGHHESEALFWLKERTSIIPYEDKEIIDFKAWNAKSIYFYDENKNIVELISRRNLSYSPQDKFDHNSLIEVSEIGLYTKSIASIYRYLNQNTGLEIFDGKLDSFCAIGDEHGLFITIDKNKGTWFPSGDKAYPSPFGMEFVDNNHKFSFDYDGFEIIR